MAQPQILICTVGTSLLRPNLEGLKKDLLDGTVPPDRRPLAQAYRAADRPAVAVLLGQALGIPVYYKHELFSEIIAFPPMPVALDFEVWMRASGLLTALERDGLAPRSEFEEDWDERYESLVTAEDIDGVAWL